MTAQDLTHQSFSFILHTTHLGQKTRSFVNPFTGEAGKAPIDDGLNAAEMQALRHLLRSNGFSGPEPYGEGYPLYREGGDCVRLLCPDLEEHPYLPSMGVELTVRSLEDDVVELVFEIASVANCVLTSSIGEATCVPEGRYRPELSQRFPAIQCLHSSHELRAWLEESVGFRWVSVVPLEPW